MKGETSAVVYSLMLKAAEFDVDETKEKFSLNMAKVVEGRSRFGLEDCFSGREEAMNRERPGLCQLSHSPSPWIVQVGK